MQFFNRLRHHSQLLIFAEAIKSFFCMNYKTKGVIYQRRFSLRP